MEPCTPYQNHHHLLLMVVNSSQWGKIHWPWMIKLMSNIDEQTIGNRLMYSNQIVN